MMEVRNGSALNERPAGLDRGPDRVARGADRLLDGAVVVLGSWTLVYHLALLTHVRSDLALVVEAALLVVVVAVRSRATERAPSDADAPAGGSPFPRAARAVAVVAAIVAASAMALDLPWSFVWVAWLVAAGAGLAAVRGRGRASVDAERPVPWSEAWCAVAGAVGLAAFATTTLRANPDDLYYVNLSQWVAAHGTFPVRDTIYSDLVYPMSNWPPLASYDALTGALAHVAQVPAGDVVYVVVPPLATALAVLALWRLLRTWRVPHVVVALAFALGFLLVDGTSSYGPPGNLFLTRLWQGKVILLCLIVPTLLTYALRYVERPTRGGAGWLFLGGVASVACSTTSIFLVPVIAVAGAAPLLLGGQRRQALGCFAALAAYPLAAGAVALALGGRSADDFGERREYRFDPAWFGHEVFLTGLLALVAVLAVLLGCLLVPHPAAKVTTAVLALAVGVTFVPGFTRLAYATVGIGPTLWRVTWAVTVAALVGVAASWLWGRTPSARVAWGVAAVAAVGLGAFGAPIWAADTTTSLVAPLHWQRSGGARDVTRWVIKHTHPGDVVLAPDGLAITIAVTTTDIKTVAPRGYYLDYLRDDPTFHYQERVALVDLANVEPGRREDVQHSLHDLAVAVACVYRGDLRAGALLRAAGYTLRLTTDTYRCLTVS